MRTIHTDEIIKNIKEMCIEANLSLTEDMKCRFKNATESEKSPLGKQILNQLQENMEIAAADQIPICQDTGMAIVFLNIGQDVHIEGMDLHDAVNEGVRQGYTEGYLRKSVVKDPLIRENTKDNTPAIMHIDIVPGENLEILVAPKGFGSENMSRIFMLKPAGIDTGKSVRLRGKGNPGIGGGEAGDLFLKVTVGEKQGFERKGNDVYTTINVSFSTAVCGGEAVIKTLYGNVICKIKEGTQSGSKIRLRGKGMPLMKNPSQKGDQYAVVQIQVPRNVSQQAKNKLKEFEALCGQRGNASY